MATASSPDDLIDQLYQLPLDEFTAARNALAKSSGHASLKALEKPTLAAWAVNQLYWHQRATYDELIKTSKQVRLAYRQSLEGHEADVRAADVFHAEAMRRAKEAVRRLLQEAGGSATEIVMTGVAETLDALPTTDAPGRLTRPLRRTGFEALAGVTIAAKPASPRPPATAQRDEDTEQRRRREQEAQDRAMARERLRFAEAAEREAEAALERARRALERAERTRERVQTELDAAAGAEQSARDEVASRATAYEEAVAAREQWSNRTR